MNKKGAISLFSLRIMGAIVGSAGFFLLALNKALIGTALIGIGSLLITAGSASGGG
ncbi:MAG: hypothetical protein AABX65_04790 [Nanoarchaeota archaeon]